MNTETTSTTKAAAVPLITKTRKARKDKGSKRTATKAKTTFTTKATPKTDHKTNACVCGCGTKVSGKFAQGHDQRVRGMLQRGDLNATLKAAIAAGLILKTVAHANARIVRKAA